MRQNRITSYVDDEVLKSLQELHNKNPNKSLSQLSSELIDIGYRVKMHHEAHSDQQDHQNQRNDQKSELAENHTEYLLKIMAIVADVYRCVRNEKSKYKEDPFEDVLAKITANAQKFINRKSGKG